MEVDEREVRCNSLEDQSEPDDDDLEVCMRTTECVETVTPNADNIMVTASPPGEQAYRDHKAIILMLLCWPTVSVQKIEGGILPENFRGGMGLVIET